MFQRRRILSSNQMAIVGGCLDIKFNNSAYGSSIRAIILLRLKHSAIYQIVTVTKHWLDPWYIYLGSIPVYSKIFHTLLRVEPMSSGQERKAWRSSHAKFESSYENGSRLQDHTLMGLRLPVDTLSGVLSSISKWKKWTQRNVAKKMPSPLMELQMMTKIEFFLIVRAYWWNIYQANSQHICMTRDVREYDDNDAFPTITERSRHRPPCSHATPHYSDQSRNPDVI